MKQHTPGPWIILDRIKDSRTLTHISNGAHIVCTLGTTRTDGSPNHSANARLIAAAPDLLAALLGMEEWASQIDDEESRAPVMILMQAREAIAKSALEKSEIEPETIISIIKNPLENSKETKAQ